MLFKKCTPQSETRRFAHCKRRHIPIPLRNASWLFLAIGLMGLSGCTTYTWPDGSQKTVIGVPATEENSRYEDNIEAGIRYRTPGEIPPKKDIQE